jgi:hypothetical protein
VFSLFFGNNFDAVEMDQHRTAQSHVGMNGHAA